MIKLQNAGRIRLSLEPRRWQRSRLQKTDASGNVDDSDVISKSRRDARDARDARDFWFYLLFEISTFMGRLNKHHNKDKLSMNR